MEEAPSKEEQLRNHIIIDGVAGHLFPITEAAKLAEVRDAEEKQILQVENLEEYINKGKIPQYFGVKLPDGKMKKYEVIHSTVESNGFKALAYREVSLEAPHEPVVDDNGKSLLRFSFQGLVKGMGDYITAAKVYGGRNATHTESTRRFTEKAIDIIGAENISALITGTHSYGAINAFDAYQVAEEKGVEQVELVLLETYGAKAALQNFARKQADEQLRQEGISYHKNERDTRAENIFKKIAEHTISINSSPASFATRSFGHKSVGEPVGETYNLDVTRVSHKDKKGEDREQTAVDRHLLSTMIRAAYSGVQPQYIGSFKEIGKGQSLGG